MDYFKLGLANLFGIIAPGLILLCGTYLGIICSLEYFNIPDYHSPSNDHTLISAVYTSPSLIIFFLLIFSYFLGAAIRLIATDVVDTLSGTFLRTYISLRTFRKKRKWSTMDIITKGKKWSELVTIAEEKKWHEIVARGDEKQDNQQWEEWWKWRDRRERETQRFPYPVISPWLKRDMGSKGVATIRLLEKLNPKFTEEGLSIFYNYCKMYIKAKSAEKSLHCEQMEAYVRFLAGSFIAGAITFIISTCYVLLFISHKNYFFVILLSAISFIMLMTMLAILYRFRYQRRREIMHTWLAFYDCYEPEQDL